MSDEQRIEEILQNWHERHVQGEEIDVDDLAREHPDLANDLRRRLAWKS